MPLPLELRNRTKAFVDVFVDRMSRGLGGMVLVLFTSVVGLTPSRFAAIVLGISVVWILLSLVAQREYIATVRKRLEVRRLDLETARVKASDAATIHLLERTAHGANGRQAAYALEVLGEAAGYDPLPLAEELVTSPHVEVRAKVFELARKLKTSELYESALAEIRNARGEHADAAAREAVLYAMSISEEPADLARRLLDHANPGIRETVVEALAARPDIGRQIIDAEWIEKAAGSADPRDRWLAAAAIRVSPAKDGATTARLIRDSSHAVAMAAMKTAAASGDRTLVPDLVRALADPHRRGAAIDALAAYGNRIVGTLTDLLEDEDTPLNIRRHLPRVLQRIPDQRSVDALLRVLPTDNLLLRSAVLKALNKVRDSSPGLNYGGTPLVQQVHSEAKYYFEVHAALAALKGFSAPGRATSLLVRTLEQRLQSTLERVFRLLGLKYPPKQIYAAYLAIDHRSDERFTAALEFLDNVLEREIKRVLLALLDEDAVLAQKGQELFRVERKDATSALRDLIQSGDMWVASCAIAAAAELKLRDLAADIRQVGETGGREVAEVARAAAPALV